MINTKPTLSSIYDIGEDLKLKFTLIVTPGSNDKVLVELLAQPQSAFLAHVTLESDLFDRAFEEFENERLNFFKEHYPDRYKAIMQ